MYGKIHKCLLPVALLIASMGAVGAAPQNGGLKLETGAMLSWSLSDYTPTPALGIAIPATVSWTSSGMSLPVEIDLSTNYAAYIEQWELSLYRESDSKRRHPIRQWRRPAAEFDAGVSWDGTVENGPPLRPGETIVALLRVRDVAGNIDEAQPQTMLISRYLMAAQKRKYARITAERRGSVAAGDSPAKQTIPVTGHTLDVWVDGEPDTPPMHLSGLAMDSTGPGDWHLSQILPGGAYGLKAQTERPIIGGARLVSVGRFEVLVPSGSDTLAAVKGTGNIDRQPLSYDVAGLSRDGLISGSQAVRLTLWSREDATGRYALAMADPGQSAGLYRDERNRSIVRFPAARREIPWGGRQDPREPSEPVKMRARYPAAGDQPVFLPHTDISDEKFFVSLRAPTASPTYMAETKHFELEPLQGIVAFTEAGKSLIYRYQAAAGGEAHLDLAYFVRPTLAGMAIHRPDGEAFVFPDNGGPAATRYGGDLPGASADEDGASASGQSWFRRNLGWLLSD